jgi:hypothetical protein
MSASATVRIGLISDTHGLLRPEAIAALAGVTAIVHAGDVGRAELLSELGAIAPLTVVRGNVDRGPWAEQLPLTAELECAGYRIHVLHILDDLALDPRAAGIDAVIFGHSHEPSAEQRNGVWYVNPGSAGPRRFRLPVAVGLLELHRDRGLRVRSITLS